MRPRERFLSVLHRESIDRMPAVCPLQTATIDQMRLSGAYWPEANFGGEKMAKLSLAASEFAGFESARVPFDVAVDEEALGAEIGRSDRETAPFIMKPIIVEKEDLDALVVPDPGAAGRVPVLLDAISRIKAEHPELPMICAHHGPFTLAAQLRGEEQAMVDIATDPEFLEAILCKCTEWGSALAKAAVDAGADAIMMIDAEANDLILGPEEFARFARPGETAMVKAIHALDCPAMVHICADVSLTADQVADSGVDGFSIGQGSSVKDIRARTRGRCVMIGNVSPATTLYSGTPDEVREETLRCIRDGFDLVAPGCGLSPKTPLVNLQTMTATIKTFRKT
ncbi:MAG TPA: MtaA/CmuA family methyltransferase [Methanomassiliicoccales archaeon]|nr:MtaA/CmuA family methyltransferase [Methanomassiliicoccales archaeon]